MVGYVSFFSPKSIRIIVDVIFLRNEDKERKMLYHS